MPRDSREKIPEGLRKICCPSVRSGKKLILLSQFCLHFSLLDVCAPPIIRCSGLSSTEEEEMCQEADLQNCSVFKKEK